MKVIEAIEIQSKSIFLSKLSEDYPALSVCEPAVAPGATLETLIRIYKKEMDIDETPLLNKHLSDTKTISLCKSNIEDALIAEIKAQKFTYETFSNYCAKIGLSKSLISRLTSKAKLPTVR